MCEEQPLRVQEHEWNYLTDPDYKKRYDFWVKDLIYYGIITIGSIVVILTAILVIVCLIGNTIT